MTAKSDVVIAAAMSQLGVPYSWGGGNASGPTKGMGQGYNTVGFDCSGLVEYAYAAAGLPGVHGTAADEQRETIATNNPKPGDLVTFGTPAHHIGIYLGNGMMIAAPRTGDVVKQEKVYSGASYRRAQGMTYSDNPLDWIKQKAQDLLKGAGNAAGQAAGSVAGAAGDAAGQAAAAAIGAAVTPLRDTAFKLTAAAVAAALVVAGLAVAGKSIAPNPRRLLS